MDNVAITNIVSARGDAMAIQLFPSNKVKIGSNIVIEDIHAGAALDTNALKALKPKNFLPNKVPRACAITVWTYTDEDSDYTENKVTFVDKDAIHAKCLTMHTDCSDSDFDGEALSSLMDCDDTTVVGAEAHSMNNGEIYGKSFVRCRRRTKSCLRSSRITPNPTSFRLELSRKCTQIRQKVSLSV